MWGGVGVGKICVARSIAVLGCGACAVSLKWFLSGSHFKQDPGCTGHILGTFLFIYLFFAKQTFSECSKTAPPPPPVNLAIASQSSGRLDKNAFLIDHCKVLKLMKILMILKSL